MCKVCRLTIGICIGIVFQGLIANANAVIKITPSEDNAFEHARALVAEAKTRGERQLTVVFADGVYRLKSPVRFTAADEGVIYRAEHFGHARFTGGVELKEVTFRNDGVAVADLAAIGISKPIPPLPNSSQNEGTQIVWNDEVLRFARWPNDDFTKIASVDKMTEKTSFIYADKHIDSWVNEKRPYAAGFFRHNWAADRILIASINSNKHEIVQAGKPSHYGYGKNGFWFGYNLLCELDAAGESYIDVDEAKAYFLPSVSNRTGVCEATLSTGLVELRGVTNLVFEGLIFENCRGVAMSLTGCNNCSVRGCLFRNVGASAISMDGRCSNNKIEACDIIRCGAGGVRLNGGDIKKLVHGNNEVLSCRISDYALTALTYAAAVSVNGCGNIVKGNIIHDGPHVGIIFGGREHLFESNEVYRVCRESGEMGAFYCGRDWTLVGNVVRGNFVHDLDSKRSQPNRAFMWDDGAAGLVLIGNVISNVTEGVSLSAVGNVIEGNRFVNVKRPITGWQAWTRPEDYKPSHYTNQTLLDRFYAVPFREEPWISRYPYLAAMDDAIKSGTMRASFTNTRIENNEFINCPEKWITGTKKDPILPSSWTIPGYAHFETTVK